MPDQPADVIQLEYQRPDADVVVQEQQWLASAAAARTAAAIILIPAIFTGMAGLISVASVILDGRMAPLVSVVLFMPALTIVFLIAGAVRLESGRRSGKPPLWIGLVLSMLMCLGLLVLAGLLLLFGERAPIVTVIVFFGASYAVLFGWQTFLAAYHLQKSSA